MADGAAGFRQGFSGPALLRCLNVPLALAYGAVTLCGAVFHRSSTRAQVSNIRSYNPARAVTLAVWAPPRSLAATWGITFVFFSSRYLDVSVPGVGLRCRMYSLLLYGLPHSDTCGSKAVCASPQLFAASRVLLRQWVPRHPPRTLPFVPPGVRARIAAPSRRLSLLSRRLAAPS